VNRETKTELVKAKRRLEQSDEELDRRKHWGVETRVDEYKETVLDNIDLSQLEETLDSFNEENMVTEGLFDNIAGQIDFSSLFAAGTVDELKGIVAEMFEKGGSRVLTTDGDTLSVDFGEAPERIMDQLEQQEIFLKNLQEDAEEKVRDVIVKGSEEGKSIGEMKDEIMDGVENMTEHRAETTARSELVKASNEGTEAALDEAGIDSVMIDASVDRQTCDEGTFSWSGSDGTEYTSCREWDGKTFDREDSPNIPRASHPSCRCALIADLDA
jgi:hypothetical protein